MRYLVYILLLVCGASVQAQSISCGNFQDINAAYTRLHLAHPAANPRTDQYVPLSFRLVGNDEGQGLALTKDIYEAVCRTNTYFVGSGIQFYIRQIDNPFNGDFFRDEPLGNPQLFDLARDSFAINVYVANYSPLVFFYSGYGSATDFTNDVILIDNDFLKGDEYALAHQLGHYFRLLHPFRDWIGLNPSDVPMYFDVFGVEPAIDTLPNGIATELVDGSNCETVGDGICDTPPDFTFGFVWDNCPLEANILDANGDTIPWQPANIMGSFLTCERDSYHFSPLQQQVMLTDYLSPERENLRQLPQPTPGEITDEITLLEPMEGEEVCGVSFSWSSAGTNPHYLVQISRFPSFQFDLREYITDSPELQLPLFTLEPDRTYYWRVMPLNFGITCAPSLVTGSFYTLYCDVSAETLTRDDNWQVSPNPLSGRQDLQVSFKSSFSGELDIELLDAQGKRIFNQKRNFRSGISLFTISNPNLPAGLYYLRLRDGRNNSAKPIIIH